MLMSVYTRAKIRVTFKIFKNQSEDALNVINCICFQEIKKNIGSAITLNSELYRTCIDFERR